MNIGELKQILSEYPDDTELFLSRDEEGNGFNSLDYVGEEFIYTEGLEVEAVHPDDVVEYGEENLFKALVLWP